MPLPRKRIKRFSCLALRHLIVSCKPDLRELRSGRRQRVGNAGGPAFSLEGHQDGLLIWRRDAEVLHDAAPDGEHPPLAVPERRRRRRGKNAGNPRGIRRPLHRVDRQGGRPLADQRHAGLRRNEARLRAESEVLRGMESPRRIGQLSDLARVFDVALSRQPAEIAGAQTQGEQAINFDREIPRLTMRIRRIIVSFRQLLQRSPNPGASCAASKSTVSFASLSYHSPPYFLPNTRSNCGRELPLVAIVPRMRRYDALFIL